MPDFILRIITDTNKKFILVLQSTSTVNTLIKAIKRYYIYYFKRKLYIEYILTSEKFIILDDLKITTFFKNDDICYVQGKEGEVCDNMNYLASKVKYDIFKRRKTEKGNTKEDMEIKESDKVVQDGENACRSQDIKKTRSDGDVETIFTVQKKTHVILNNTASEQTPIKSANNVVKPKKILSVNIPIEKSTQDEHATKRECIDDRNKEEDEELRTLNKTTECITEVVDGANIIKDVTIDEEIQNKEQKTNNMKEEQKTNKVNIEANNVAEDKKNELYDMVKETISKHMEKDMPEPDNNNQIIENKANTSAHVETNAVTDLKTQETDIPSLEIPGFANTLIKNTSHVQLKTTIKKEVQRKNTKEQRNFNVKNNINPNIVLKGDVSAYTQMPKDNLPEYYKEGEMINNEQDKKYVKTEKLFDIENLNAESQNFNIIEKSKLKPIRKKKTKNYEDL